MFGCLKGRTNRSAALPVNAGLGAVVASVANDILSGDGRGGCARIFVEDASRKGFRDTGRGGASRGD